MCELVPRHGPGDYECSHPAEYGGLCIFHLRKPTEAEKREMPVEDRTNAELIEKQFRERFYELVAAYENNPTDKLGDFRYFDFPAVTFDGRIFSKGVDFSGANFRQHASFWFTRFGSWAYFYNATFTERADFFGAEFSNLAGFIGNYNLDKTCRLSYISVQ